MFPSAKSKTMRAKYLSSAMYGPDIAARVIEVVSKKTFDRVSAEKLFRPLGMRNTSFYNEKGSISPSNGAVSSAFDYMKLHDDDTQ